MSSSSSRPDSKPEKRRFRKRLPPLPPGPKIQFVVASRPEDFKSNDTMRYIRSHVMYKHRAVSPSGSVKSVRNRATTDTRALSPATTVISDGMTEDLNYPSPSRNHRNESEAIEVLYQQPILLSTSDALLRNLASRIVASITAEPARSAPATLDHDFEFPFPTEENLGRHESLEELRDQYIHHAGPIFAMDSTCARTACSTHMSFLSHVAMTCTYQDLADGLLTSTALTEYAKSKVLSMITDSVRNQQGQADDFTILSILHHLVSEIGGHDERVIDVHQGGLINILHERGGLFSLGCNGALATFLTIVILNFTVLRGLSEPTMFHGFMPTHRTSDPITQSHPISPLYAPRGDLSLLYNSCPKRTFVMLSDIHNVTSVFLMRWTSTNDNTTASSVPDHNQLTAWDTYMQQTYETLTQLPPTANDVAPDWIYECTRLAALIYCGSMAKKIPFSEAAAAAAATYGQQPSSTLHFDDTPFFADTTAPATPGATSAADALLHALHQTDLESCWGDLSGVFLWVCLVGGRAVWPAGSDGNEFADPSSDAGTWAAAAAWRRKFFALHAVRASILLFAREDEAAAVVEALRRMGSVLGVVGAERRGEGRR